MMRNWKQLTGLGIFLLALGGLATWDEWKTKKDEQDKETKGLITTIKPESVVGIVYHSTGDSDTDDKTSTPKTDPSKSVDATLKLVNGRWEITSPVQAAADQQAVTDLLKNITDYKTESEVTTGKDKWATFGLTNPRRSIELETNDGKKTVFFVGVNSPVGFGVYAATSASDTVYSGSQYIATSTGKNLFDLRDKKIFTLTSPQVTALILKSGPESITLAKEDGKWLITAPVKANADTVAVSNLLDDITGLKAAEFIESPDKTIAKALSSSSSFAEVTLTADKANVSLKVADVASALYAQLAGSQTVYKLHDDAKTKLKKSAKDLRDKKVFTFQSASIAKVNIDGENFTKVASDWYSESDATKFGADGKYAGTAGGQPKPQSHIRGLIVDLEYARAEDVYEPGSKEMKNLPKAPKHKIILFPAEKPAAAISTEFWLAQDNPEMVFLRHSGAPQYLYKAKRSIIASITPSNVTPAGNEMAAPNVPN